MVRAELPEGPAGRQSDFSPKPPFSAWLLGWVLVLGVAWIPAARLQVASSAERQDVQQESREIGSNRQRLLELLTRLSRDDAPRMICGQNLGVASRARTGYAANVGDLSASTPGSPTIGLIGVDYGWGQPREGEIADANRLIIEHCRDGGIVTICWHPGNPLTGSSDVHDLQNTDLASLLEPGTEANVRWHEQLDLLAHGLGQLQAAGVVVLWRPFHEMNGGWFWWCGAGTAKQDFIRLWRDHHEFLTVRCALNNLLFVYSPAVAADPSIQPVDYYYPGHRFVDIVGLDVYADQFTAQTLNAGNSYVAARRLGKPLAIAEVGPLTRNGNFDNRTMLGLTRHAPHAAYFLVWHSWRDNGTLRHVAIRDNRNGPEFLSSPQLIHRDELRRRLSD